MQSKISMRSCLGACGFSARMPLKFAGMIKLNMEARFSLWRSCKCLWIQCKNVIEVAAGMKFMSKAKSHGDFVGACGFSARMPLKLQGCRSSWKLENWASIFSCSKYACMVCFFLQAALKQAALLLGCIMCRWWQGSWMWQTSS